MIKTLSIVSLLLLSAFTYAQKEEDDDKKGQLGVLAGWNCANATTVGGLDAGILNGAYGGVMWEQKIIPTIRVQSGFLFIQNGFKQKNNPEIDYTTLNYLTLPLIGKVKVGPVYGLAGLTTGFRVGGTNEYEDGTARKVSKDKIKTMDFGAQLGIGFQVLMFGIEGRYTWGLTNISKVDGTEINNRAFELGVHVHLF